MTPKQFIKFVKKECKKNKVRFYNSNKRGLKVNSTGELCNGYFCEDSPELAVATGKDLNLWFPVLVHEYCHMRQWLENSPLWYGTSVEGVEAFILIDLWLANKIELSETQKNDIFRLVMRVEADCEKRSIKLIKKLKLPLDIYEYAQKANAYIIFYEAMKSSRSWYVIGEEPYNNPKIYKKMPKKIISNVNKIDPKLVKLFF